MTDDVPERVLTTTASLDGRIALSRDHLLPGPESLLGSVKDVPLF